MNAFNSFDTGGSGSQGPWLQWSARGTQDGAVPAKSFYIREEAGKTPFNGFTAGGVVLDIANMKTGWQKSDGVAGVAPEWKWNASLARFEPQPGEDFKRGFSIRVALGGGKTALWEQSGAAVWNAFTNLVPALREQPAGDMLPLVRMTGTKLQQFKRGSTVEPILEVVKWVPRPDCLKEGAAAGIDTGAAQPTPQPVQQAAPQPAPAAVAPAPADAADIEF